MLTLCRISQDPLIFHSYNFGNIYTPVKQLAPYIRQGKNIHIVLTLNWSMRQPKKIERLAESFHAHAKKYPWIIVTVLANEQEELDLLRARGVRSELCNQNCLINESSYTIRHVEKRYDAVSNSRMAPYKRLELLRDVDNCALITYFLEQSDHDYEKYILPHAGGEQAVCQKLICPQFDGPTWRRFNNDEVCNVLSASRCGVILSAEEGACFAAVEYLLCGLPVVTTPSIDGRDAMFDSDYVIYAEPDPESVAEAVKKAANLTISPEEIRERTIAKIRKGREQYCRILDNIAREEGVDRNFLADWDSFYVNKMINGMSEDDTIRYLNASGVETHYSLLHRLHNMHRDFKLWLEHRAKR